MRLGEVEELVQGPLLVSGLSWSGNRDVAETQVRCKGSGHSSSCPLVPLGAVRGAVEANLCLPVDRAAESRFWKSLPTGEFYFICFRWKTLAGLCLPKGLDFTQFFFTRVV